MKYIKYVCLWIIFLSIMGHATAQKDVQQLYSQFPTKEQVISVMDKLKKDPGNIALQDEFITHFRYVKIMKILNSQYLPSYGIDEDPPEEDMDLTSLRVDELQNYLSSADPNQIEWKQYIYPVYSEELLKGLYQAFKNDPAYHYDDPFKFPSYDLLFDVAYAQKTKGLTDFINSRFFDLAFDGLFSETYRPLKRSYIKSLNPVVDKVSATVLPFGSINDITLAVKIDDWKRGVGEANPLLESVDEEVQYLLWDTDFSHPDNKPPTITATSTLGHLNNAYAPSNLSDMNPKTAWVEGVKGDGVGESITLEGVTLYPGAFQDKFVFFVNGYAKSSSTWHQNNRVKELLLFYTKRGKDHPLVMITLNDTPNVQWIRLDSDLYTEDKPIRFKIVSVYKGTHYSDTAISTLVQTNF